jgi:hypothetical protein
MLKLALSIALTCVCVALRAQAAEPGWIADPSSGCKVWDLVPEPNEAIKWSGGCAGGLANGSGVLQWFIDGKPVDHAEGEWRDGKRNGHGVYTTAKGNRYDGEWRDDMQNGFGVLTLVSGNRYAGEWRDGMKNGHGVYTWASGDRYDGEWRDDKRTGHGVYTRADGSRYDGEWRDGKPNGFGTFYFNGNVFHGDWTNGCLRQGAQEVAIGVSQADCQF